MTVQEKFPTIVLDTEFRKQKLYLEPKYGKLTPIKLVGYIPYRDYKRPVIECKCDCGKVTFVRIAHLRNKQTTSCGCIRKEIRKQEANRRRQQFEEGEIAFNRLYKKYKRRNRETKFLSKADFKLLTQQNCHYCNSSPSNVIKHSTNGDYVYQGLDRKDSSKGYTIDNVVPCCIICNRAKNNLDYETFQNWIRSVAEHNKS